MTTPTPRATVLHYMHDTVVDSVKAASGGRFVIESFAAGELYPADEALDQIARGTNEMAATYRAYFAGKNEGFRAWFSPGETSAPHLNNVLWHTPDWIAFEEELWGTYGVELLGYHPGSTPDMFCFREHNPRTVEEWKGLKVRTIGIAADMFELAGVETVWLAGDELYTAIATGTIDGTEYSDYKTNWELGLHEVCKYAIENPPHERQGGGTYIVNPEAFAALPDEFKAILKMATNEALSEISAMLWLGSFEYRKKWMDYGVELYTFPLDEMAKFDALAEQAVDAKIEKEGPDSLYAKGIMARRLARIIWGEWFDNWAQYPELVAARG